MLDFFVLFVTVKKTCEFLVSIAHVDVRGPGWRVTFFWSVQHLHVFFGDLAALPLSDCAFFLFFFLFSIFAFGLFLLLLLLPQKPLSRWEMFPFLIFRCWVRTVAFHFSRRFNRWLDRLFFFFCLNFRWWVCSIICFCFFVVTFIGFIVLFVVIIRSHFSFTGFFFGHNIIFPSFKGSIPVRLEFRCLNYNFIYIILILYLSIQFFLLQLSIEGT